MWGRRVLPAALPAPFSATLSPALWVYLCTNVGLQGLLVVRLPAPFIPHSASLGSATARRVLSAPVPVSAPPTGLDECLFFIYLVSDFLAIRFSVSSGCTRRHSVSTYAAILVLPITSVLNSASGRLFVEILFSSFYGVLFYFFIWDMFLYLLILSTSLCFFLCIRQSCYISWSW